MRTRAMTAMAVFAVLVGVAACGSGTDNAGTIATDTALTGTGATGMSGGTVGTPAGMAADSTRRADSIRTDSINRAAARP